MTGGINTPRSTRHWDGNLTCSAPEIEHRAIRRRQQRLQDIEERIGIRRSLSINSRHAGILKLRAVLRP
jgi:hypothetical protein